MGQGSFGVHMESLVLGGWTTDPLVPNVYLLKDIKYESSVADIIGFNNTSK